MVGTAAAENVTLRLILFCWLDHVPDGAAAGPLLQNHGGIPDPRGEGVARLWTQNGGQVGKPRPNINIKKFRPIKYRCGLWWKRVRYRYFNFSRCTHRFNYCLYR